MGYDLRRPKALLGASIPRSGHHYLQRTLSRYFRDQIFYCEWYTPADCCKQVPCVRRPDVLVTYQKSHDWEFSLPRDIASALYLIQYRHPVPEALSDRDLAMRDNIDKPSQNYRLTEECYAWWLAAKAIYYRNFHDKWFRERVPNAAYLDYERLLKEPADSLRPIIRWASGEVDEPQLADAITEASETRGGRSGTFTPRVIEKSRHYNRELLGAYEAYVLDRCPAYGFHSEFSGSYLDHPMYALILAQDPDEPLPPGEQDRLDAAAHRAPGHPEIQLRLARRELEQGNIAKCISMMEDVLGRNPYFGAGYRLLAQACRDANQGLPETLARSEALFACTKYPDVLADLAETMAAQDRIVNAISALSIATVLHPQYYRAHHLLAKLLAKEKRWAQARVHADKAAELEPENKRNARLLTRIDKHLSAEAA